LLAGSEVKTCSRGGALLGEATSVAARLTTPPRECCLLDSAFLLNRIPRGKAVGGLQILDVNGTTFCATQLFLLLDCSADRICLESWPLPANACIIPSR